jgi:7-cyano-7-deazaguanine synthase in queuosine biosynthesis
VLPLTLWAGKRSANTVTLEIEDLHEGLFRDVPAEFEDLLEIATYVYCADQATSRGGKDVDTFGVKWRRDFEFLIPVRAVNFWNRPEVKRCLKETLSFVSDDSYEFHFEQAKNAPAMQQYFREFGPKTAGQIERVVLFSGGLDSLAGAVEECIREKRRVMLVTHRPTPKLNNIQRKLEAELGARAGTFAPSHLHVRICKKSELNKNYTQRTRSFLYAAVGATVARMLGLQELRFYENGLVSINLPMLGQVVGSRATRTTHPKVLAGYADLFSAVAGKSFGVLNEFVWDTKGDVIRRIISQGCGNLIADSVSCAHTFEMSTEHPHCGTCSQCIDRRMALVAVGEDKLDPADRYASDVFVGERPKDEDRMMVAGYTRRAERLSDLKDIDAFVSEFPEVLNSVRFLPGGRQAVIEKLLALHKKHGAEVNTAIERQLEVHKKAVRARTLPANCLLRLTYDTGAGARFNAKSGAAASQETRWEDEEEKPTAYRLVKHMGYWDLVFAGRRAVVPEQRGLLFVNYLVKNPPDEPIHATKLQVLVDGAPVRDGEVGGVIDEASGRKLDGEDTIAKAKAKEYKAAVDDDSLSEEERVQAQKDLEELGRELLRRRRRGGQAGASVDAVRKAVWRFISDLKETKDANGRPHAVLVALADHLEKQIWIPSMGDKARGLRGIKRGCFTYVPPQGVVWKG